MDNWLKKLFAGVLVAMLLGVQGLGLVHELSDVHHDLKERCAFCVSLERNGPALVSSPVVEVQGGFAPAPDSHPGMAPRTIALISVPPRGPPA